MTAPQQEPTDERLVCATLAGDDGAFAVLVGRHKRRVLGLAARFARDHHALDDLAQETFLHAWRYLRRFRNDAPFEHWLIRIAVRVCYDYLRRVRRDAVLTPLENLDMVAKESPAPEQAREIVAVALARLRPDERLVVTLLELEERSVKDVADLTGWSESNVKVRAFRARQALRKILERQS
ncbi:MAG: RNA polymerase sigma factor [Verrucomicrobia bacterium]|nr:MAG: RNA polymerase sigma factor [Verrucomicrobiota bacterium]